MNTNLENLITKEEERSNSTINLIASENYPSVSVRQTLGTLLGAKYAEGYPGKRYYAGCSTVDEVEIMAIDLAKMCFGAEYANVQPHSGSNANIAVYHALLSLGEKILAPRLDCGGHLTHGSPASATSEMWAFEHYGVNENGVFDYEEIHKIALEYKPKLIIAGTSAYPLSIDFKKFREIADEVGAFLLADVAHLSGLIVGGAHMQPLPHAHVVTTTTQKTLRGPRGGIILTNDQDLAKKINKAIFPRLQGGPHMHTIAGKAQCLDEALSPEFAVYISQVIKNSKTLHDELQRLGCTMWTDHTDTHLTNIDTVKSFGISGILSEKKLELAGIIANRESMPFDKLPPTETSGLRVGTPAMTTRGMKENEMKEIAGLIFESLKNDVDISDRVSSLAKKFPIK